MSGPCLPRFRAPTSVRMEIGFSDWIAACRHLCDHVLTPPEMCAWTWILPAVRPWAAEDGSRFRLGRRIWRTGGKDEDGRELLRRFMDAVERSVGHAAHLGWSFREGDDELFLGPEGILTVVGEGGLLRSAYISLRATSALEERSEPSGSDAEEVVAGRSRNPFPREGRIRARAPFLPWSEEERGKEALARFRIFRHASGEVRSRFLRASSRAGRERFLPVRRFREARRDFETWKTLVPPPPEESS